jgi:hypothetical protein
LELSGFYPDFGQPEPIKSFAIVFAFMVVVIFSLSGQEAIPSISEEYPFFLCSLFTLA